MTITVALIREGTAFPPTSGAALERTGHCIVFAAARLDDVAYGAAGLARPTSMDAAGELDMDGGIIMVLEPMRMYDRGGVDGARYDLEVSVTTTDARGQMETDAPRSSWNHPVLVASPC